MVELRMGHPVREWRALFLIVVFVGLSCLNPSVQSVAAASEWPLGLPEEYTTAWINITYKGKNGTLVTERSQSGRFGKGGKIAAVSGVVVHVKSVRNGTINHYGCDPIINDVPKEDWIALIRRGMCDFDMKLLHAHEKKAIAMVVYDREDSDTLEDMKLSAYTIPGVFTYKSRGERIANLSDSGARVEMHIAVGEVCSRPYSGINRTSVLFVSISFIVLMIISLAWLVFYYVQRFRYLHAKDRLAQRLCNAAKKALAKIPTRSIKQTDKEGEGECCAVCIEFYKPGDMLRTLPCRHEFHKCCVDPWLLEHRTCPMCKMDILKHYGYIFTGSQESILHLDLEDGGLNSSDSMDTTSPPSPDNPTSPSTPQGFHHSSTIQRIDSLPVSPDENLSAMVPFSSSHQQNGDVIRKPSLISLTVVATPNGCVTAVTPTNHAASPTMSPTSEASDNLIRSLSEIDPGTHNTCGNGSRCNSLTLIPSMTATTNESPLTTCQSPTSLGKEHPMCQYKDSRRNDNHSSSAAASVKIAKSAPEDSKSSQPLLSPGTSDTATVIPTTSSDNLSMNSGGGPSASTVTMKSIKSSLESCPLKSCQLDGISLEEPELDGIDSNVRSPVSIASTHPQRSGAVPFSTQTGGEMEETD